MMARKQNDYLANLLDVGSIPAAPNSAEIEAQATASAPPAASRASLSLLGRENALARIASGEVRQVTQLLLDPARVRVWEGNARWQHQLSEDSCGDLIESIIAEGGQKVPVVVRHLADNPDHDYELVVGSRRHFAISWLRRNSYPEFKLLAHVAELNDEAAFRLADLENRARKDISDVERARNYAAALDEHYGGRAVRMAERLKLSKGWLSKMLKVASLPDPILQAFGNLHELTLSPAYKLAQTLDQPGRAKALFAEAEAIATENKKAVADGRPSLPSAAVLRRLLAINTRPAPRSQTPLLDVAGNYGRPIMAVKAVNRQGITLHLPAASGASDEELADGIKVLLGKLRESGIDVA